MRTIRQRFLKALAFVATYILGYGILLIDARHPTVEFDGPFSDFLAAEERLYGLKLPTDCGR